MSKDNVLTIDVKGDDQRSKAVYFSIVAMLLYSRESEGNRDDELRFILENANPVDLKNAIKPLRAVRDRFIYPEVIDGTIRFICREFLHEEGTE